VKKRIPSAEKWGGVGKKTGPSIEGYVKEMRKAAVAQVRVDVKARNCHDFRDTEGENRNL